MVKIFLAIIFALGAIISIIEVVKLITINEQILKFAQNYPTISNTASSDAPFLIIE